MSDSQMKNIGQIQPAKKPTKNKITSAYQHSSPRSQMSWRGIHTSQHVGKNNRIACEIVYFHRHSPRRYSNRNQRPFQMTRAYDQCGFCVSLRPKIFPCSKIETSGFSGSYRTVTHVPVACFYNRCQPPNSSNPFSALISVLHRTLRASRPEDLANSDCRVCESD